MRIALVGNGPSYKEHVEILNSPEYDLRVGCNYTDPLIKVDYSAFCDSKAARLMRDQGTHESYRKGKRLILGERAEFGLSCVKSKPGGSITCLQLFLREGLIKEVLPLPFSIDHKSGDGQKFFTSGHMAYQWICRNHASATVHVYGVDSLFTGDPRTSYSQSQVSNTTSGDPNTEVAEMWKSIWRRMTAETYPDMDTTFIGPDGQTMKDI